ncbi:MAG: UDP- glucuronosyltransferase [Bacteroidia bacterium]|nr:UDP- glucuronosyltransferase [Bacteroidia bacterium]
MKKKFLLAVQGEGRGHMMQALTLREILVDNGHEVCCVVMGACGDRKIPDFFFEKIKAPVELLPSPNFVTDKKNKSINVGKSVGNFFMNIKKYRKSLNRIDELMKEHKPDLVINFFDVMMGLYYQFRKPAVPMICIAHQYIYLHPDFKFPDGFAMDKWAVKFFTKVTASRSKKNLALSFYNLSEHSKSLRIVPPLLRKEIFELPSEKEEFFLVYLVNNGYMEEIVEWHKLNPEIELHCFADNPDFIKSNFQYNKEKLFVHPINDKAFLEKMAKAKGLASTAGFESVCEAMYLGKPVLMVPVQGHYEQFCNSRDGHHAGAGVYDKSFDLGKLNEYTKHFNYNNPAFRQWVSTASSIIYTEINAA